jgi:ABC-type sugar transport system ATPase subunit
MILHNYVQVLLACDRVNLIQDGTIALDKPTSETSVEELTDIVVNEYKRAREETRHAEEAEARDGAAPGGPTGS